MEITNYTEGKLKIGKREWDVKNCELNQKDLIFYVDNPRVYSALRNFDGDAPSQEEIEKHMCSLDRIKELKESIKENGGLINPLIVRDGDFAVLEGNSRLAAYRILAKQDPIKWSMVKCMVLPADIDESSIMTLLGVYHIVGTKDWSPYEQAGFLYRRKRDSKMPIELIAKEVGISKGVAENYIKVFEYMMEKNDLDPDRWSYYEEFLKNAAIKKEIAAHPELENVIVEQIQSGEIEAAADIRKIGKIAKSKTKKSKKVMEQYRKGETDLYSAYSEVQEEGGFDKVFQKVREFRDYIIEDGFVDGASNSIKKADIVFDLKKIRKQIGSIIDAIDGNNDGN